MSLGTIFLIVLVLILVGVLPTWGHSDDSASNGRDIARKMNSYLPLIVAIALFVGGCGGKDEPQPVTSPTPAIKPQDSTASVPPAPLPRADTAKGAEVQSPQPGQANDHSSPAFKGGGMPDKKK